MLTRIKRGLKKVFTRDNQTKTQPIFIDGKQVVFQPDNIEDTYMGNLDFNETDLYLPKRQVTHMEWNGAKVYLKGYFYIQGIDTNEEDFVRKDLVFFCNKKEKYRVTLRDLPINKVDPYLEIDERYNWSGFEGEINFATFTPDKKPIENGEYSVFLEIEVFEVGNGVVKKLFPVGNVEKFFANGFHSAKMEHFTAKRELKYNLIVSYDYTKKTLKITSTKLRDIDPRELGLYEKESNDIWYRLVKKKLFKLAYVLFCLFPLNDKKVLFASDSRNDMSGNFHFVYSEMRKQNLDFQYRFILRSSVDKKKTIIEILQLAYEIATSKFIVLDDFYPMIYKLRIRRNADLVQLWHAVGAFKTFGFSRIGLPGGPSPKSKNHRNYTKVTVSSSNIIKHYAEGFGINPENILPTGVPRTDVFFDESYKKQTRDRIYKEFPFLKDKKIIMFAPTFRGNGQQSAYYDMEALNLQKLYEELHGEYIFLFKLHPFVKNDLSIPYLYKDFYYDFSDYREINDLLFVTDILITDYSSVCFEFALLNKPMLFFGYDVEDYVRTRDFYFEYLSFIPGALVKSSEEIITKIKGKDFKMEKIPPFIDFFFDDLDGKASERVVNNIFK